jgi:toxin-antitoxin system PIN domain toxin
MVTLLDVNVLVALFDPRHLHHEPAHQWFERQAGSGWATCPLTENGLVRVLSSPGYKGRRATVAEAANALAAFREFGPHEFWPATPSISDTSRFDYRHMTGHRQVTDVYLLALAVERGGSLATFDRALSRKAVLGARATHLAIIAA